MIDLNKAHKKTQYITIDSQFITSSNATVSGYSMGGNNNFSINFGSSYMSGNVYSGSNVFIQELKNVIGFKMVDFYVTQIASTGTGSTKFIDILCPDLPDASQILDERKSKIFARVPLERSFASSNVILNDKEWKTFPRETNYFNPLSIKQLPFQMWEMFQTNANNTDPPVFEYKPLQPDASFYMVIEITTIDNTVMELPKDDTMASVIKSLESLTDKFESFVQQIPALTPARVPVPEPVPVLQEQPSQVITESLQKQRQMTYWVIALLVLLIVYFMFGKNF